MNRYLACFHVLAVVNSANTNPDYKLLLTFALNSCFINEETKLLRWVKK